MNQVTTSTTIFTNATNGVITRITKVHHQPERHQLLIVLGVLSVVLIATGLYLLFVKRRPK